MSTLTFLFFIVFLHAAGIGYKIRFGCHYPHEFEQFWSLHMFAPRRYIGRGGTRTRYPQALSQPRYQ